MSPAAFFRGFDLEEAIAERAAAFGVPLDPQRVGALADHARGVAEANARLHLTTITEPREFVHRHLGEAFQGAALLEERIAGTAVDLGSGNGYPGLPLGAARPGLSVVLVESSEKKAAFLREVTAGMPSARVLERHVQRHADLDDVGPVSVLLLRALGGWERVVPKLVPCLEPEGRVLLWAGERVESVIGRTAWRRLRPASRVTLEGRDRSWIWVFRPAPRRHSP